MKNILKLQLVLMFLIMNLAIFSQERIVTIPGTIQSALGGTDWDASSEITKMTMVAEDIYEFKTKLPKGNYLYKIVINKSWDENYGSNQGTFGNMELTVPVDNSEVKFMFNYKTKEIKHEVQEMNGFVLIPILTNTIEQKGKNNPISLNNEFELGIISKNLNVSSKFSYEIGYDKDSTNKYSNLGDDFEVKDLKIDNLYADYKSILGNSGFMINNTKLKDSTDYLQIIKNGAKKDNGDDRENTKNPAGISSNNVGFNFSTDKFGKLDIYTSKYMLDIYEDSTTERFFTSLNFEKDFGKKLKLGTSNVLYQVTLEGKEQDLLMNNVIYGKYNINDNINFKGEIAFVPTGSILDDLGLIVKNVGGNKWEFILNPKEYGLDEEDVDDIHIVGDFTEWKTNSSKFPLEKQDDGTWIGTYEIDPSYNGKNFKFFYNGFKWSNQINPNGIKDDMASFKLEETQLVPEGLKNGLNGYMAELEYTLPKKGKILLGTKGLSKNVYMPFAKDELLDDNETGFNKLYLEGDYNLTDKSKLSFEKIHKSKDGSSDLLSSKTKLAYEIKDLPYFDHIKTHILVDPDKKDDFEGETKELFIETQINKLPILKYAKLSATERLESETSKYTFDTQIKDTFYFIEHIKGNVTYAKDKVNYKDDAMYYFAEIKLTDVPGIYTFIPYISLSYESDNNGDSGIVDSEDYMDKDDNDWLKKIKLETKFSHRSLEKWDGLIVAYETQKIEEEKIATPEDFAMDEKYYVSSSRAHIDWYSILTLSTAYNFTKETKAKLIYKYDINHEEISKFEDDGLKIEFEKKIGKTTFNASYNKQDNSEGDDYTKVSFKTVF